jgi:hypothetical protein
MWLITELQAMTLGLAQDFQFCWERPTVRVSDGGRLSCGWDITHVVKRKALTILLYAARRVPRVTSITSIASVPPE